MALTAGGTASFYAYTIYMQKFLANTSGFDRATASQIMTVALTIMLLIQPLAGRLSDRVGRKPLMIFFGTLRDAVHLSDLHRPWSGRAACRRPSLWSWPA